MINRPLKNTFNFAPGYGGTTRMYTPEERQYLALRRFLTMLGVKQHPFTQPPKVSR
jgi:hypothetical protein